jgi:aldose sugar dehydrogenase
VLWRKYNHIGKVIRITTAGRAAEGNPFAGSPDAKPEIWSYGHRNVQAAALHPETGELWTSEHGAQGGDEINVVQAGKNYGWPVITYGKDYSGAKIGEGTAKQGMEQPIHYWDPSIAPSGMLFYTGNAFPGWKGNLFIGSLKFLYLNRITLQGNKVISEEKLLSRIGERIRDVAQDAHGNLYVVTDNTEGKVLKLSPAKNDHNDAR